MEISFSNEFKRKGIHFLALSIPIGYFFLPKVISLLVLVPIALGAVAMDIIRLRKYPLANFINKLIGPILREHEEVDLSGASYILSTSVFCILVFTKTIAIAAISFIILGDIASALVGRRFGKTKIKLKSVEGTIAFFLVCFGAVLVIPGLPLWVGAVGAIVASAVEAIHLPLDDNLWVPVTSGLVMQALMSV